MEIFILCQCWYVYMYEELLFAGAPIEARVVLNTKKNPWIELNWNQPLPTGLRNDLTDLTNFPMCWLQIQKLFLTNNWIPWYSIKLTVKVLTIIYFGNNKYSISWYHAVTPLSQIDR